MANDGNGGSFVTGFVLGGVIGAVVGILLAPKPGSETRTELLERSEAWRLRAEELAAQLRERVGSTVEGVRERGTPVAEQVSPRVGRRSAQAGTDGLAAETDATGAKAEEKA